MAFLRQGEYAVRCEWGLRGLEALLESSDVIVIVDVLSFSTCVDIAVARGAMVFPYRNYDGSAQSYAASVGAILASHDRSDEGYTLSPVSLAGIQAGTRLVLPSPNGSTLSLATAGRVTLAGCLRNSRAVAEAAKRSGERISVIPAGERWPDGSLRPAIEDLIGAGSIIQHFASHAVLSPEAEVAIAAFERASVDLPRYIRNSVSGQELIKKGFEQDVELASQLDCSQAVPQLIEGAYRNLTALC